MTAVSVLLGVVEQLGSTFGYAFVFALAFMSLVAFWRLAVGTYRWRFA